MRGQCGFAVWLALACLAGCGGSNSSSYDRGRSDGYAVGYNTACEIRTTLIEGDWGNAGYSRGYADGQVEGTIACAADRRGGLSR
jgi:hypothetical protein